MPTLTDRRSFLRHSLLGSAALIGSFPRSSRARAAAVPLTKPPLCSRPAEIAFQLAGPAGDYLSAVTRRWLLDAPESNPAMLEMFRDRDRQPLRDLVPWAGEFAGKHLVSSVQVLRVTGDAALRARIAAFVARLIGLQADDGYLGPWPAGSHLTGQAPNAAGGATWDAWGHYHALLGLLLWHEESDDPRALEAARRLGDLLCATFAEARLVDTGSTEMNLAPIHGLCLLHRRTGEPRYLALAARIRDEFAATSPDGQPLAGDYLRAALAGKEFFETPKPRWESLHPIMGLAELHWITGDDEHRRAFEHLWWSIAKLDRHNNGGFTSGEQAQGNPYHLGPIETCCTVAWVAMGVEMLRLTGESIVADELELSTLNSVLGLHSPNGRWCTYNTPMDGTRVASAQDIVFQARAGSPELNCCSVNGPRALGLIGDWALMAAGDAVLLNWFGPSTLTTRLPSGVPLVLTQETAYPRDGAVLLRVAPEKAAAFTLKIRIPHWSGETTVRVNGEPVPDVLPGRYLALERAWQPGDTVEIAFDFTPRFWVGERECAGKVSLYHGPLLLAYDRRFNTMDPDDIPPLDAVGLVGEDLAPADQWLPPILLREYPAADGRVLRLCDFASAGTGGSPYRSWLPIRGATPTPFSRENPRRSGLA